MSDKYNHANGQLGSNDKGTKNDTQKPKGDSIALGAETTDKKSSNRTRNRGGHEAK